MAGSTISVSIITIACVVCATMLVTTLYPAMDRASSSVTATAEAMGDQIRTDIEIIEVAKDSSDITKCYIWVKNIGSSTVAKIGSTMDVFFGETGDFTRMSYKDPPISTGEWTYTPEGGDSDARWDPKETLKITINNSSEIIKDVDYYVKIILYNGESAEDVFSFST